MTPIKQDNRRFFLLINGGKMEKYLYQKLTARIIQAFYKVYNTLDFGLLEKVD